MVRLEIGQERYQSGKCQAQSPHKLGLLPLTNLAIAVSVVVESMRKDLILEHRHSLGEKLPTTFLRKDADVASFQAQWF